MTGWAAARPSSVSAGPLRMVELRWATRGLGSRARWLMAVQKLSISCVGRVDERAFEIYRFAQSQLRAAEAEISCCSSNQYSDARRVRIIGKICVAVMDWTPGIAVTLIPAIEHCSDVAGKYRRGLAIKPRAGN